MNSAQDMKNKEMPRQRIIKKKLRGTITKNIPHN